MVVEILNLSKCIEKLDKLRKIDVTSEIIEATEKVRNTAVDMAPVDIGFLRGSIKTRIENKNTPYVQGIVFTTTEYAIHQEFGTTGAVIVPTNKKALRWKGVDGKYHFAKRVVIPPLPPQPFMRPALNINRAGIQQSMKKYLRDKIREAVQ